MWLILIVCIYPISAIPIRHENNLNYECETNLNCTDRLANSICLNKKCICQFGYKADRCILDEQSLRYRRQINYDNDTGIRMLGDECSWTNQCRQTPIDRTKLCLDNKCQCAHGYIPIDVYRCIKDFVALPMNIRLIQSYANNEPSSYGSLCLTHRDCQYFTMSLECFHGMCICRDGYLPLGKYLCHNIREQERSAIMSSSSSTIRTNSLVNNDVIRSLGKIGNTCINDYFCRRTVPESHCYNGECACRNGYIPIDRYTCMKNIHQDTTIKSTSVLIDYKSLLGGNCQTKYNCHTSNAICLNYICTCPKGYFPVDDWTCLQEPEPYDDEYIETTSIMITTTITTTTTTFPTTTVFRWWPWSPTTMTRPTDTNMKNTLPYRCLLNRQCAKIDQNSHCTLFGRCVCNQGYQLKITYRRQYCIRRIINEDDCD